MKPPPPLTLKLNQNRINGPVEVLQITDLHLLNEAGQTLLGVNTEETFLQIVESAIATSWPPDLIVLTGDLCQEPIATTYQRLDRILHQLNVPCVCLPGNHDDPQLMLRELKSENVSCSTQVLCDKWQMICLDSSEPGNEAGHFSDQTFRLLTEHLDQYSDKFALLFFHHHPIPVGCEWLDTMVLNEKNKLFTILESRPQCRALSCGHIHQALDTRYRDLQILGTPSTCFQFKPNSENFMLDDKAPGYRRICLYPDGSLKTEVIRLAGLPKGLNLFSSGYRN